MQGQLFFMKTRLLFHPDTDNCYQAERIIANYLDNEWRRSVNVCLPLLNLESKTQTSD